MSLDVSLYKRLDDYDKLSNEQKSYFYREYADYIKWYGSDLSFDEWFKENGTDEVFEANITHNLNIMAGEAGIYEALWRPYRLHKDWKDTDDYDEELKFEESVSMKAKDIIPTLEKGLSLLKREPEYFKKFNAKNGWGTYKDFVPWVENYLEACKEYPEAEINISR